MEDVQRKTCHRAMHLYPAQACVPRHILRLKNSSVQKLKPREGGSAKG